MGWSSIVLNNTGSGYLDKHGSGIGNVGAYLLAPRPYITGSTVPGGDTNNGEREIKFPYVTRNVLVINKTENNLLLHFNSRANTDVITQKHYITLGNTDDAMNFPVRCTKVYISSESSAVTGSFELFAELTSIDEKEMHELTGSGINSRVPY